MVCQEQQLTDFKFSTVDGRLTIEIPWWNANALRNRLVGQGVRATACFDPITRTAASPSASRSPNPTGSRSSSA